MIDPSIKMNINAPLEIRQEFNASSLPLYIGEADSGSGSGDPVWRIRKIFYDGTKQTLISYASGTGLPSHAFNKIWKDRDTYVYKDP